MSGAHREESASRRNLLAFWLLGLLNNYGYVVFLSAAEDLITGASGAVLVADILPTVVIKVRIGRAGRGGGRRSRVGRVAGEKRCSGQAVTPWPTAALAAQMTAPFWVHRVPYATRILICGMFGFMSFLMAAAFRPLSLRLLGVAFASVCSGWGEVTFLALTSHYGRGAVGAWSSGTGFAGIAGAGWYLFLRSVLGASARLTLALGAVFPLFYVATYAFLLTKPPSVGRAHDPAAAPRRKGPVQGSTLLSADAVAGRESGGHTPPSDGSDEGDSSPVTPAAVWASTDAVASPTDEVGDRHSRFAAMTTHERFLRIQPLILPYMLPLFLVYFAVRREPRPRRGPEHGLTPPTVHATAGMCALRGAGGRG